MIPGQPPCFYDPRRHLRWPNQGSIVAAGIAPNCTSGTASRH